MAKASIAYNTRVVLGEIVDRDSFTLKEAMPGIDSSTLQVSNKINNLWDNNNRSGNDSSGKSILITYLTETSLRKNVIISEIRAIKDDERFSLVLKSTTDFIKDESSLDDLVSDLTNVFQHFKIVLSPDEVLDTFLRAREDHDILGTLIVSNEKYANCLAVKDRLNNGELSTADYSDNYIIVNTDAPIIESCNSIEYSDAEHGAEPHSEWIGNYYIPECVKRVMPVFVPLIKDEQYLNIIVKGESGCGKTTFAEMLAEYLGFEFGLINAQMVTDPEVWFGKRGAKNASTYVELNDFANLLQQGDTVILIDEINRLSSDLANPLMPVLDDRRNFEFDNKFYDVAPGTIFVLSANLGYQYAGTFALDAALTNRKQMTFRFGDLPNDILKQIITKRFGFDIGEAKDVFVSFDKMRTVIRNPELSIPDIDMSVRALINFARLVKYGLSHYNAMVASIVAEIDELPKEIQEVLNELKAKEVSFGRNFDLDF